MKFQVWNFKRIIIIINYQNGSGKPRKFSRSDELKSHLFLVHFSVRFSFKYE